MCCLGSYSAAKGEFLVLSVLLPSSEVMARRMSVEACVREPRRDRRSLNWVESAWPSDAATRMQSIAETEGFYYFLAIVSYSAVARPSDDRRCGAGLQP